MYVEKPFTVDTAGSRELISLAVRHGLKLTVGHDEQFSHATRRMRELVRSGYLGGPPVHMESTWCYDLGDPVYAKSAPGRHAALGSRPAWRAAAERDEPRHRQDRRVPGRRRRRGRASGRTSPLLSGLGERQIIDELRVIITDAQKTTAYFTFSSQMRPALHQLCVYGRANGLVLDEDRQTLVRLRGQRYKSYLEQFVPPLTLARQYVKNWAHNAGRFLARDFHVDSSRKHLIEAFHRSITSGAPVPIPYREILLTSRIMDAILEPDQRSDGASRAADRLSSPLMIIINADDWGTVGRGHRVRRLPPSRRPDYVGERDGLHEGFRAGGEARRAARCRRRPPPQPVRKLHRRQRAREAVARSRGPGGPS